VPTDLAALLSVDPGPQAALDWFIGSCLYEANVWESPRTSDGLHSIARVLERGPDCLNVCGRIWTIDQTIHAFWLQVRRDGTDDRYSWFLAFEVAYASSRKAENALDNHDRPEDIEWHARISGEATVEDGALAIVPDSTRVIIRDMPEPEPAKELRRRPRSGRPASTR